MTTLTNNQILQVAICINMGFAWMFTLVAMNEERNSMNNRECCYFGLSTGMLTLLGSTITLILSFRFQFSYSSTIVVITSWVAVVLCAVASICAYVDSRWTVYAWISTSTWVTLFLVGYFTTVYFIKTSQEATA